MFGCATAARVGDDLVFVSCGVEACAVERWSSSEASVFTFGFIASASPNTVNGVRPLLLHLDFQKCLCSLTARAKGLRCTGWCSSHRSIDYAGVYATKNSTTRL